MCTNKWKIFWSVYVNAQQGCSQRGTVAFMAPKRSHDAHRGLNRGCHSEVSVLRRGISELQFPSSRKVKYYLLSEPFTVL